MFQIRDDHMNAFRETARENFEDRAIAHARAELPRQTASLSDDDLRQRVRSAVDRGRQYGFTTERDVICFFDTGLILGESFDSDPRNDWTLEILRDPELSAAERSQLLLTAAEATIGEK